MTKRKIGLFVSLAVISAVVLIAITSLSFSAAKSQAAVQISFDSPSVAPGSTTNANITVDFPISTDVVAFEFALNYDPSLLRIVKAVALEGFRTTKFVTNENEIRWLIVPERSLGKSVTKSGQLKVAQLSLETRAAGSARITFVPGEVRIAAIDYAEQPVVYNAAVSSQVASLRIAASAPLVEDQPTDYDLLPIFESIKEQSGIQRITNLEIISLARSALLLANTKYGAMIRVDFGRSQGELTSTVESTEINDRHMLRIIGLEPQTRYYYRVSIVNTARNMTVSTQTRSFVTTALGEGSVSADKSEVRVFPQPAENTASIIVVPKNESGEIVEAQLGAESDGGVEISDFTDFSGARRATVSKTTPGENFTVQVSLNGQEAQALSVVFDKDYTVKNESEAQQKWSLTTNSYSVTFMILLLVVTIFSLILVVRQSKKV